MNSGAWLQISLNKKTTGDIVKLFRGAPGGVRPIRSKFD